MTARVAVLIPTFQRAAYLRLCLDSILRQTFSDLVVVVHDNASEDGTSALMASYDDPRVRHVRHPENLGLLANHNACLDTAEELGADYFLLLSDDDVLLPTFLERTVPVLDAHPSVGMVHTRFDMIDAEGGVIAKATNWTGRLTMDTVEPGPVFVAESMDYSCRVCASSALLRTAAVGGDRFRQEDFPPIDFGFWLRLAARWDVAYVDQRLMQYRIHGQSHSAALGAVFGGGYLQETRLIDKLLSLKTEFLDDHPEVGDVEDLRRRAVRARPRELLLMARGATLPERRLRRTAAAVRAAAAADPSVLTLPGTWSLLVGSVLGRRVVEKMRSARDGC